MSIKFMSLLVGLAIIVPTTGFAAANNEEAIRALQAQIQALQQQLTGLVQNQQSVDDQPGDEPPSAPVITFDRDLYYGLRNDADVSNLQEFLIDQGFLPAGSLSGNFFILTQKAVQQFQSAHGLRSTGFFGPLTRTITNKILAQGGSGGGGGGILPIRQPFYSVEPTGPFIRGQRYDFNAKISHGKPNAPVLFFLQRPEGSMKYDGIACLGSAIGTKKCALYTDALGSLQTASYELVTDEGQNGTWVSWVTVGGVVSNKLYHTVISSDRSSGYLTIDPAYMELKIGGSQRIRAIFTSSRPPCLDADPACRVPEQAPYEVDASFSSDNPSIANIVELALQCVRAPLCEGGQVSVRGISLGGAVITASYMDSGGRIHQARMKVNVISVVPPRQNLPPIISGLKGPTALQVGEKGTWTIQARDPENGSLAYHITWGDEEVGIAQLRQSPFSADKIAQTAIFTHVYTKAGTFAPLFVVVDEGNLSAQTSASVVVGGGIVGSIKPMVLSDIQKIVSVTPASVANLSFGVREVNAQYNLGAYHQGKWYEGLNPGISDAVWVEFGWPNTPEVNIALLDESGRERKIYLPAVGSNTSTFGWYYWIAEDGSSYYAHTSHGPGWPNMTRSQALTPEHLARREGTTPTPSPSISLIYPKDGYTWYLEDQNFEFDWSTSNFGSSLIFIYLQNSEGMYIPVAQNVPNTGSYILPKLVPFASSVTQAFYPGSYKAIVCGQFQAATSYSVCSNKASLTILSRTPTPVPSTITVVAPNGGETWTKGTTQTIKWQDNTTCPIGTNCILSLQSYDIKLASYYPPCTGEICPAYYPYIAPYTIANAVYGSSYSWSVGKILNTGDIAPDGSYTIQICQTGSKICDSSDSYFKIISGGMGTNNYPIINSIPAIPSDIKVGQSVSLSWGATDADGDNLSWSVSWGDGTGTGGACAYPNAQNKQNWTLNMSHTWQQAGTYPVKVTVDDCRGGSDVHTFNITVGSSISPINNPPKIIGVPAIPVNLSAGTQQTFSWTATDADGDNLAWSVDWGDGTGVEAACAISLSSSTSKPVSQPTGWTFTQSHAWKQAGTYKVSVAVSDCKGGKDTHVFTINIESGIVPANGIDFTVENIQLPISTVVDKEAILTFDIINRGNETFFWQKYGNGVQWSVDYLSLANGYDTSGRIISDGCNTSIELVPGAGCRVSVGYTFRNAGVKTLPITADYAKQVQEINENNNTAKPTIMVSAPNYDACRLDKLDGSNITKRAIEDQKKCLIDMCDVYGPANLSNGIESDCVFQGKAIKRYTNARVPVVNVQVYPDSATPTPSDGPLTVGYGQSVTVTWKTENVTSCTASGNWPNFTGTKALQGSESTAPNNSGTYTATLTCASNLATISDSVTISVASPTSTPVPTSGINLENNSRMASIANTLAALQAQLTAIAARTNALR